MQGTQSALKEQGPCSSAHAGGRGTSAWGVILAPLRRGVFWAWLDHPPLQESEQRDTAKCKFDNQTPCWGSWTAQPALIPGCLGRCSLAAQGLFSILSSLGPPLPKISFQVPADRAMGGKERHAPTHSVVVPPLTWPPRVKWGSEDPLEAGKCAVGWRRRCCRIEGVPRVALHGLSMVPMATAVCWYVEGPDAQSLLGL